MLLTSALGRIRPLLFSAFAAAAAIPDVATARDDHLDVAISGFEGDAHSGVFRLAACQSGGGRVMKLKLNIPGVKTAADYFIQYANGLHPEARAARMLQSRLKRAMRSIERLHETAQAENRSFVVNLTGYSWGGEFALRFACHLNAHVDRATDQPDPIAVDTLELIDRVNLGFPSNVLPGCSRQDGKPVIPSNVRHAISVSQEFDAAQAVNGGDSAIFVDPFNPIHQSYIVGFERTDGTEVLFGDLLHHEAVERFGAPPSGPFGWHVIFDDLTTAWLFVGGRTERPCVPTCGNRVLEPGEECDDGNTRPDDGCDCSVTSTSTSTSTTTTSLSCDFSGTWSGDYSPSGVVSGFSLILTQAGTTVSGTANFSQALDREVFAILNGDATCSSLHIIGEKDAGCSSCGFCCHTVLEIVSGPISSECLEGSWCKTSPASNWCGTWKACRRP